MIDADAAAFDTMTPLALLVSGLRQGLEEGATEAFIYIRLGDRVWVRLNNDDTPADVAYSVACFCDACGKPKSERVREETAATWAAWSESPKWPAVLVELEKL